MAKSSLRPLKTDLPYSEIPFIANAMHTFFVQDRALFTAVNPQLDEAWGDAFGAAIAALVNTGPPDMGIGEMKLATQTLNEAMREGCAGLQRLFLYVRLAWPGDESRYDAFGLRLYTQARQAQGAFLQLMKMAHAQATAHFGVLSAKGYTAANLAALEAAIADFESAKLAQLAAKSARVEATEAYYARVNTV